MRVGRTYICTFRLTKDNVDAEGHRGDRNVFTGVQISYNYGNGGGVP